MEGLSIGADNKAMSMPKNDLSLASVVISQVVITFAFLVTLQTVVRDTMLPRVQSNTHIAPLTFPRF